MRISQTDGTFVLSPSDLSRYVACQHLSALTRLAALGEVTRPPPFEDPTMDALRERGVKHEEAILQRLRDEGRSVADVSESADRPRSLSDADTPSYEERLAERVRRTEEALAEGVDVVYQGLLARGPWMGYPDFLVRVEVPSDLGEWSYEVVDAKLSREPKVAAVLQLSLYSDLLGSIQGRVPDEMHLELGGPAGEKASFRVNDFGAYFRSVRNQLTESLRQPEPTRPQPVEHCKLCDWRQECTARWRHDDDLCLVAGITTNQRREIEGAGIRTLAALAESREMPPTALDATSLKRVRDQARVQLKGRREERAVYELLPPEEGKGLLILPEPSEGDLFFDIEGDAFVQDDGLEYLFGFVDAESGYSSYLALDRGAEKTAFEKTVDLFVRRRERWPGAHVYHYGHYETTALKRLAGYHATRADEVDGLLRAGAFVDLHRAVKQGLIASVESYSIKKMEPLYGFERTASLARATRALVAMTTWLDQGGGGREREINREVRAMVNVVEAYNRDDCLSTLRLRDWLEGVRNELERENGLVLERPLLRSGEASDEQLEVAGEIEALRAALLGGGGGDPEREARRVLAYLLDFHRREDKSAWWRYFERCAFTDDELVSDRGTLGGLSYEGEVDRIKRSIVHRYRFPTQEHGIELRSRPHDPGNRDADSPDGGTPAGEVVGIDNAAGFIDLKRAARSPVPHPEALVPMDVVRARGITDRLTDLAKAVNRATSKALPRCAEFDLLLRHAPRGVAMGTPDGETQLDHARRMALALDRSVLPVQGPPGTGKTYAGARMIVALLADGRRVGVTANSHKVITNLLDEVCRAADEEDVCLQGVQRVPSAGSGSSDERVLVAGGPRQAIEAALDPDRCNLAAGTAWFWATPQLRDAFDTIFVDEAGQMSLANTLAVAHAAKNLVLLGDPQQLDQPMTGVHPPGIAVSALGHVLGQHDTIPRERGLFLPETWRMHPEPCRFTSEAFYVSDLHSRPGLDRQRIEASGPLVGYGLRLVPVEHAGNRNHSPEEVEAVGRLLTGLLDQDPSWIDPSGRSKPLSIGDVLIVAPYNKQVDALKASLPEGARVGTVDKFQGQEAPCVIYSMATSTAAEAPKGMEFLYSPNRLNVATSRARCLAVIVANPALFTPECRTVRQARLANAFCRFREMAEVVGLNGPQPGGAMSG